MRKALRVSVYGAPPVPGSEPMTVVTFEDNLVVTADGLAAEMRVPGILVITEVFETSAADELGATAEAMERIHPEERNMAVMFYWIIAAMHNVSREGFVGLTGPNPLTVDQTVEVFEQVRMHPLYDAQRISTPAGEDGTTWVILDGRQITTEDR